MHDCKLLAQTIEAIVVERPDPDDCPQNLCLDKATTTRAGARPPSRQATFPTSAASARRSSTGPARSVIPPAAGSSSARSPGSRSAGILIRYDKKAENYLGLIQLACALLWYRRLHRLKEAGAF